MSLLRQPDTRQSVCAEAMLAVVSVERRRSYLRLDATVRRLMGDHPACPLSFDELKDYMLRFALRERVAMEIG